MTSVREAYDVVAEDYGRLLPDTRAEDQLDLAMVDAFAQAVTASGGADVLDAGCGTGRMSRYLTDRGCRTAGLDLSPGMIAVGQRRGPTFAGVVGSLHALPFPDQRFDGVLLWYSTIHTPPPGQPRIFSEARRVLRTGGHVLVGSQSGGGRRDVGAHYRRLGHDVTLERHLYLADEIATWLQEAGLLEVCRLVRRPRGAERDDQAMLLAARG